MGESLRLLKKAQCSFADRTHDPKVERRKRPGLEPDIGLPKMQPDAQTQTAAEFGFGHLEAKGKGSLAQAAYMNTTRYAILEVLKETGLAVECGSGGRTKYNRAKQGYPKRHWLDAMCVGESGTCVFVEESHEALQIKATGRGGRQKCNVDKYGFPRGKPKRHKRVRGFASGDMVVAVVPKGKNQGRHIGRVLVRQSGRFDLKTKSRRVAGISYKYCELLQRNDGYSYE